MALIGSELLGPVEGHFPTTTVPPSLSLVVVNLPSFPRKRKTPLSKTSFGS